MGNIVLLKNLGVTNRERLYSEVCGVVLRSSAWWETSEGKQIPKVPFQPVKIAADGSCGWRAILAFLDLPSFRSVPRTYTKYVYKCMGVVYIYIIIYHISSVFS